VSRPPAFNGRGGIAELPPQQSDGLVAQFGQGLRGVAGEFGFGKEFQQDRSQRDCPQRTASETGQSGFKRTAALPFFNTFSYCSMTG
jgi:hypothetical protein